MNQALTDRDMDNYRDKEMFKQAYYSQLQHPGGLAHYSAMDQYPSNSHLNVISEDANDKYNEMQQLNQILNRAMDKVDGGNQDSKKLLTYLKEKVLLDWKP